jgi:hypothetical protein
MRICAIFVIWACTAATVPTLAEPPKYIATPIAPGGNHSVFYSTSISDAGEAQFALLDPLPNGRSNGKTSLDGSYVTAAGVCEYVTRTGDLICYGNYGLGQPVTKVSGNSSVTLLGPDGNPAQSRLEPVASDRFGNVYGNADGIAMKWLPDGTPQALGKFNGRNTWPTAANNVGALAGVDVAGTAADPAGEFLPFIYRNNQFTRIEVPHLHDITVAGIWDDGTVIGSGVNDVTDSYGNYGRFAWFWRDGVVNYSFDPENPEGAPHGTPLEYVRGANTTGLAVGSTLLGGTLFYPDGTEAYLTYLLADPVLAAHAVVSDAYAVNDAGQILVQMGGRGSEAPPFEGSWFILTPVVPEPNLFWALPLVHATLRRRRREMGGWRPRDER